MINTDVRAERLTTKTRPSSRLLIGVLEVAGAIGLLVPLTIWFSGTDSPAKFVGEFNADRTVNTGAWQWPGGGYESTMTRLDGDRQ